MLGSKDFCNIYEKEEKNQIEMSAKEHNLVPNNVYAKVGINCDKRILKECNQKSTERRKTFTISNVILTLISNKTSTVIE